MVGRARGGMAVAVPLGQAVWCRRFVVVLVVMVAGGAGPEGGRGGPLQGGRRPTPMSEGGGLGGPLQGGRRPTPILVVTIPVRGCRASGRAGVAHADSRRQEQQ